MYDKSFRSQKLDPETLKRAKDECWPPAWLEVNRATLTFTHVTRFLTSSKSLSHLAQAQARFEAENSIAKWRTAEWFRADIETVSETQQTCVRKMGAKSS